MALLCYNKGCGQSFDPEHNAEDSCLYHPGVPIFHDALKGWSCCKKRTTDFSEFLSIKVSDLPAQIHPLFLHPFLLAPAQCCPIPVLCEGCPFSPASQGFAICFQGPSNGHLCHIILCQRHRQNFPLLLSPQIYQGPESNTDVCTFHPGVPVFHEGMKYWSCCGIKTTDFSAFMEQPGCSRGCHCWTEKKDKKAVLCRQDWHQTGSQVVVTVYAKNPLPALSSVKANRTVLEAHVIFEGNKIFQAELELWGTIDVEKSFVSMVPAKVEITLCKASPGSWARLELPQSKLQNHAKSDQPPLAQDIFGQGIITK
uniref:Integrin subunit beta 1 binding protein 2 n=1 Tax=Serinus canaria TaxID=9135 RepID=A0A8C9NXS8_SERCA